MDLAKIRKKSLMTTREHDAGHDVAPSTLTEPVQVSPVKLSAIPVSAIVDVVKAESIIAPVAATTELPAFIDKSQVNIIASRSPMETILAGRAAAGCDDESAVTEDITDGIVTESILEFLCFRVSNEIYGINIMDIKEIIKPREVTEVPRAPLFISGVLSLRGTIIPIIDMRIRLGLFSEEPTCKERIIVIKNNNSLSGLLVDEVIQVVKIPLDAVEAAPTVLDGIDRDFVSGIGRSGGHLIIILNLENISDINLY